MEKDQLCRVVYSEELEQQSGYLRAEFECDIKLTVQTLFFSHINESGRRHPKLF